MATHDRRRRAVVERRRGWLCLAGGLVLLEFARSLDGLAWLSVTTVEVAMLVVALRAFRRAHIALHT
jgi:hypothetical protein